MSTPAISSPLREPENIARMSKPDAVLRISSRSSILTPPLKKRMPFCCSIVGRSVLSDGPQPSARVAGCSALGGSTGLRGGGMAAGGGDIGGGGTTLGGGGGIALGGGGTTLGGGATTLGGADGTLAGGITLGDGSPGRGGDTG